MFLLFEANIAQTLQAARREAEAMMLTAPMNASIGDVEISQDHRSLGQM